MSKITERPSMKTWTAKTEGGMYVYQSEPSWNNGRWAWDKQAIFVDAKILSKINKAFGENKTIRITDAGFTA